MFGLNASQALPMIAIMFGVLMVVANVLMSEHEKRQRVRR